MLDGAVIVELVRVPYVGVLLTEPTAIAIAGYFPSMFAPVKASTLPCLTTVLSVTAQYP